ncbi:MAG TPA: hypothetical protein PLB86_07295 [Dermatophilaceae bacterium]|nr:hypothetical protein [Dermatophilaceae bacterium]
MPAPIATTPLGQTQSMQGILVPASSVRPEEFFHRTRRHTLLESARPYAMSAAAGQDVFELRKSDILSRLLVRFTGSLVITTPTGTAASTARWPYDMLNAKFTANGASNVINASGLKLKARDAMKRGELSDRGVSQTVGGAAKTQGTLAMATESWGVGSNSTLSAGTYPVDLMWIVPVAEDEIDLVGAIFLATSTADLTLTLDYAPLASLFTLTGTATAALTGTMQVTSTKFSVPIGSDGQIVVPDLSTFHSLIQSRTTALQNGENEIRIVGQGGGKSLLRTFYQVWNGAVSAPLAMTTANYGKQSWRYGNNETPDEFIDGSTLRYENERLYNTDLGGIWGFGCHEFASELAFRDVVDMGTTSDLRIISNIAAGVTLTNPAIEYVTETVFQAGTAA